MNAGMYGMADGRGMAGRKFIGRVGYQLANSGALIDGSFSSSGLAPNALTTVAGVRTRLLSTTGRGALRFFGICSAASGGTTYRFEIVADGVTVLNAPYVTGGSKGPCVFGGVTSAQVNGVAVSTPVLDYLPFDSSIEVYLTASASEVVTSGYYYLLDLHQ